MNGTYILHWILAQNHYTKKIINDFFKIQYTINYLFEVGRTNFHQYYLTSFLHLFFYQWPNFVSYIIFDVWCFKISLHILLLDMCYIISIWLRYE